MTHFCVSLGMYCFFRGGRDSLVSQPCYSVTCLSLAVKLRFIVLEVNIERNIFNYHEYYCIEVDKSVYGFEHLKEYLELSEKVLKIVSRL